ncbi:hypothetical protein NUW58_g5034 [Xylaria curta]|uniref:Uncharacterized protein n=1 Tax=Xylaria curta TaxID=42375 RepID=A0ACC1P556_9PEZI|nr:hypothetical protein NUW58_g5034 [Xylaria curta]
MPGLVSLPVRAGATPAHLDRHINRRAEDIYSSLSGNSSSFQYYIQLYLGDPPNQAVEVLLGTDYNDFWVNPNCSTVDLPADCRARGFYDPAQSSTSNNTRVNGSIIYQDRTGANFTYYTDKVSLSSGRGPSNVRFGVASNSNNIPSGVLGVGLGALSKNGGNRNFIEQLADQQFTNSRAFSLALGSGAADDQGVIIFGGVDTKKFSGKLVSNDILGLQGNDRYARYNIQMTGAGLTSPSGTFTPYESTAKIVVAIDAGTTYTYLPDDLVWDIYNDLQATYYTKSGGYALAPCAQRQNNSQVSFTFGSISINVPFSEFLTTSYIYNTTLCNVGLLPRGDYRAFLGLSFLRSAYVVFDQTQGKVLMQQYVNCGTNERVILSSGASGFVGECNPTKPATPSGDPPASSPTAEITPSSDQATSGLSTSGKAGVGVGVAAGGILIIALVLFLVHSRRQKAARRVTLQSSGVQDAGFHSPGLQYSPQNFTSNHTSAYGPSMAEAPVSPQFPTSTDSAQYWVPANKYPSPPNRCGGGAR